MSDPAAAQAVSKAVPLLALGLVAISLATRAWVGFGGYFTLDDYVFYTRAGSSALLDRDYLLDSYNGHLMPGSMVWVWLSTKAAPLDFIPVMVTCLVLQAVVYLLAFMLLKRLFGLRPAILVPFSLFAFTTLTLPGMVWWAAALNQLPQQLFLLLALLAHLRYLRTERFRDGCLAPAAIVAGLAFSEKTALAIPLLFVVTWLFFVGSPLRAGLRLTATRYRQTWLVHGIVAAVYAAAYIAFVEGPVRGGLTFGQVVELLDVSARRTVLPGLLGGPWRWQELGVVDSLADPHPLAQVVVVLIAISVVGFTVLHSTAAWRAWALAGVALLVEAALLLATRVQVVGVEAVGAEYRYFTDFALVAMLALGLALLPVVARTKADSPVVLTPTDPDSSPLRQVFGSLHPPTVAMLSVVALVLSSVYSAAAYRDRWADNPAKDYFANATAGLESRDGEVVLYDGPVPTIVVWRLLWPATLPSELFEPMGIDFETLTIGRSTTHLTDIDSDGTLRTSVVSGIAATTGPASCGWELDAQPATLPLEAEAFNWNWIVELSYSATSDSSITLAAGDTTTVVPLPADEGKAYVSVTGALSSLEVSEPSAPVCIESAVVGLPQPVEW